MKQNATMQKFEAAQMERLAENTQIPEFSVGDTVRVNVRIREGNRERVQAYEGVCIARKGSEGDVNSAFTVRKITLGEGVERVFPLYSPRIDSIELVRRGSVRRAKLYYLRDLRGKKARISERTTGHGIETEDEEAKASVTKTQKIAQKKEEKKAKRAEARKAQEAAKQAKLDAKAADEAAQADEAQGE